MIYLVSLSATLSDPPLLSLSRYAGASSLFLLALAAGLRISYLLAELSPALNYT